MTIMNDITKRLSDLLDGKEGFDAAVLFDCAEAGAVLIDGTSGNVKVTAGQAKQWEIKRDYACSIAMTAEILLRILDGEMDQTAAFMHGEMRLSGEVGLATQVSEFMAAAQEPDQAKDASAG